MKSAYFHCIKLHEPPSPLASILSPHTYHINVGGISMSPTTSIGDSVPWTATVYVTYLEHYFFFGAFETLTRQAQPRLGRRVRSTESLYRVVDKNHKQKWPLCSCLHSYSFVAQCPASVSQRNVCIFVSSGCMYVFLGWYPRFPGGDLHRLR